MSEASIPVEENHLQCPICIELLKDPVSIPCGHTYCMDCIKKCWDQEEEGHVYSCPQCRQTFTPRPVLGRNPILADMVAKLKAKGLLQKAAVEAEFAGPGDVQCTICIGRRRKAGKSCLECQDSCCTLHFCRHDELHAGKRHKVVEATADLQSKMCLDHGKPLEAFCKTDKKCVCILCITEEHKGHDVVSAEKAKQDNQSKMCLDHGKPLEAFCKTDEKCVCILCITEEHKGHDVVSAETAKQDNQLEMKRKLQTEINKRETELMNTSDSLEASSETMEKGFAQLMAFFEQKRAEVAELIRAKERAELSRTEQLQEEVRTLRAKTADLERLRNEQDDIHFLQNLPLVSPDDLPCFVDKEKYSFASEFFWKYMMEKLEKACDETVGDIWRQVNLRFFSRFTLTKTEWINRSCKPKLDKGTAFRHHDIQHDCRTVEWSNSAIRNGYQRERFNVCRQVLCEDAAPQVAYWMVKWKVWPRYEISIAVAYHSIPRNGNGNDCRFGRNENSWCLEHLGSSLSFFHKNHRTIIPGPVPSEVGVYVNQDEGHLAFYDLDHDDPKYIFGVQTIFTQPLYPGFYVTTYGSVTIS